MQCAVRASPVRSQVSIMPPSGRDSAVLVTSSAFDTRLRGLSTYLLLVLVVPRKGGPLLVLFVPSNNVPFPVRLVNVGWRRGFWGTGALLW